MLLIVWLFVKDSIPHQRNGIEIYPDDGSFGKSLFEYSHIKSL